jgi:hypothetical protein
VTSKITFGENSRLDFIKQEQAFALWLSEAWKLQSYENSF